MPKYPEIEVKLIGENGNAFLVLGKVRRALARGGVHPEQINQFMEEGTQSDYGHLLRTAMKWVTVI